MKSAEREHYGMAVYCARRFQGRGVPMEELIGEAEAALLWAASRFDENRGARFSTYAVPVVLGALRELCRRAQPMHVPRSDLRILSAAQKARAAFCDAFGREPALAELAQAVGVEAARLGEMLAAHERMRCAWCDPDWSAAGAEEGCFEDWLLLRDAIRSLPRPYTQVLWLRCVMDVPQKEVARRLGVGQPQVSRWERRGKELLRESLAAK